MTTDDRPTLLAGILDRTLECVWLAAVVALPTVLNVYSVRVFEADKAAFLRSLAAVALAIWIARRIEGATTWDRRVGWVRHPMFLASVAVVLGALLSNLISIAPGIAFWGSYERMQGTSTLLAYATLFFTFISTAGHAQVERLLTAALIGSLAPSLYALVQVVGLDPIAWGEDVVGRMHSTAGNPIFLGGFLVMVIPLAVGRALGAMAERRIGSAFGYSSCVALNLAALLSTQSRGPLLALAAGLGVFLLAALARRRWRWSASTIVVVATAGMLALLVVRMSALPARWDASSATEAGEGSARVRLLLWQGAAELIAASHPERIALGHGLDTLRLAYPRFYPAELGRLERRESVPDRAHNDFFDTIVHLGILGLVARLAFFAIVLGTSIAKE